MSARGLLPLLLAACAAVFVRPSAAQAPRLNELMASNTWTLADEDGDFTDWIELFNPGPDTVYLDGYGLSDDEDEPYKWTFPAGAMPPGAFRVVFASGKDRRGRPGVWASVAAEGDLWRYRPGDAEPPAAWTDPGFDATGWSTGPSGIGYGDDDDATVVEPTMSVYARFTFTLDDPARVTGAFLHIDYDDGFVAYLNGEEIARANVGTAGVRPRYDEGATRYTEPLRRRGLPLEAYEIVDPETLLRTGENVFAVQVHNYDLASSDLSLVPFLTLGYETRAAALRPVPDELASFFDPPLHTGFRLSAGGESVYLTAPGDVPVESVVFGALPSGVSYGRAPGDSAAWVYFTMPTPGEPNTADGYAGIAPAPAFDRAGGVYDALLTLQISAPDGGLVRYTLDGAVPTPASPAYQRPLLIGTTTVVRARVFQPGLMPGPVETETYLLREDHDLPVVSLSTDPANLWDEDVGIYVRGPGASTDFPYFGANFWDDREVPVHMELFEPDGLRVLDVDAGLAIFGGWTRGHPQKSLALFARGRYGTPEFQYAFFPDRPQDRYQNVVLRNAGNDWNRAHLRDGYMQALVRGAAIDGSSFRPAVVYLNGEYWGIHHLREKLNEHYAAARAGVDAAEVDLLENDHAPLNGTDEDYRALLDYLETHDPADEDVYAEVGRRIDLDNFIDYQVAQIYFDNRDWPGNNIRFYRPRAVDGRWRWVLYDTDFGFGLNNAGAYRDNTLRFATEANGPSWPNPPWSTYLFRRLLRSQAFQDDVVNRFADFLNGPFQPSRAVAVLDSLSGLLASEMPRHRSRWGGGSWSYELSVVESFARNRPAEMIAHLRSYFGLGSPEPVTVRVSDGRAGHVRVHRLDVREARWTGTYFSGTPVRLTALPAPGYRFVRWSGSLEATTPVVTVDPAVRPMLTAHFEPASGQAGAIVLHEIQYHAPEALDSDDWVELYNAGTAHVDLGEWVLRDEQDDEGFVLPAGTLLAPGGFLVLARDVDAFAAAYPDAEPPLGPWTFGLGNGGEAVRLFDAAGALVDSVAYLDEIPWPAEADGDGATLELLDPAADNADVANWRASTVFGGTPGRANSVATAAEPPETLPARDVLEAPFPNPTAGPRTLVYRLAGPGRVVLRAYDVVGRRVAVLTDASQAAGRHEVRWDAAALPAGLYLVELLVDGERKGVQRIVQLR